MKGCQGLVTISFNCLADLVSIIMLEYYYKGIGRGVTPRKFLFNLVHFMDFVSNLDSRTGPDSKYN